MRAPFGGIVQDVTVEVGGAALPMMGRDIATIVALDPMLAVVEVSERRLGGLRVGDTAKVKLVTGETLSGKIRYVAKTASQSTRTRGGVAGSSHAIVSTCALCGIRSKGDA